MTLCIKCNLRSSTKLTKSNKLQKYCSVCIVAAISRVPNLDCEYCMGEGEYYGHSSDCDNDDCALAGGCHDCMGQMIECHCSILDGVFDDLV